MEGSPSFSGNHLSRQDLNHLFEEAKVQVLQFQILRMKRRSFSSERRKLKHKHIYKSSKKKTHRQGSRRMSHRRHGSSPSSSSSSRQHRMHSSSSSSSNSSSSSSSSSSSFSRSVSSSTANRRRTPHFRFKVGEKIGHKYRLTRLMGDGTFGRVVEGRSHEGLFAIKIIKPVHKYIDSARTEKAILKKIMSLDEKDEYQIVRYVESFYHYDHYCLVFKPLGKSLYDVIKKNAYQGFPIRLVQSFFRQILRSVGFLHRIGYTHTDLKPENILLQTDSLHRKDHPTVAKYYLPENESVRIIDFGSATHRSEKHSSVINTRQYRSPEVLLECCQWEEVSDVWSIGCIVVELFTGELLFETHEDHEHALLMEKNSGPFPPWMTNQSRNILRKMFTEGRVIEQVANKHIENWENIIGMKTVQRIFEQDHAELCDLLLRCLEMNPHKRISCKEALEHRFFGRKYD